SVGPTRGGDGKEAVVAVGGELRAAPMGPNLGWAGRRRSVASASGRFRRFNGAEPGMVRKAYRWRGGRALRSRFNGAEPGMVRKARSPRVARARRHASMGPHLGWAGKRRAAGTSSITGPRVNGAGTRRDEIGEEGGNEVV